MPGSRAGEPRARCALVAGLPTTFVTKNGVFGRTYPPMTAENARARAAAYLWVLLSSIALLVAALVALVYV
jgi:hypothetical protein